MNHPVFRKMRQFSWLENLVTPAVTIISVQDEPKFSQIDIRPSAGKSLDKTHIFHKRNHRIQFKEGYKRANSPRTTFSYQDPIRTQEDIIFANRILRTWDLLNKETIRRQKVLMLVMQETIIHDYLESFYGVIREKEFNKFITLKKKINRQCKDAIESYYQFVLSNMEVCVLHKLVPKNNVPNDKILFAYEFACGKPHDKHQSSRNKKKKFSQYKRAARKQKQAERDFFLQDWIDDDSDDCTFTTFENVEEEQTMPENMTCLEKAFHELITAPCIEEAAWAIYTGTESEHTSAISKADQLLNNYLDALNLEI